MHRFSQEGKDIKWFRDVLENFCAGDQIIRFALIDGPRGIELVINIHLKTMIPFEELGEDRLRPAAKIQAGLAAGKGQRRLMQEIIQETDIALVIDRIVVIFVLQKFILG